MSDISPRIDKDGVGWCDAKCPQGRSVGIPGAWEIEIDCLAGQGPTNDKQPCLVYTRRLAAELEEARERIRALIAERDSITRGAIRGAMAVERDLRAKVESLTEQLCDTQGDNGALEAEVEALRAAAEQRNAERDAVADGYRDRAAAAEHHASEMTAARDDAKAEVERLREQIMYDAPPCKYCRNSGYPDPEGDVSLQWVCERCGSRWAADDLAALEQK